MLSSLSQTAKGSQIRISLERGTLGNPFVASALLDLWPRLPWKCLRKVMGKAQELKTDYLRSSVLVSQKLKVYFRSHGWWIFALVQSVLPYDHECGNEGRFLTSSYLWNIWWSCLVCILQFDTLWPSADIKAMMQFCKSELLLNHNLDKGCFSPVTSKVKQWPLHTLQIPLSSPLWLHLSSFSLTWKLTCNKHFWL